MMRKGVFGKLFFGIILLIACLLCLASCQKSSVSIVGKWKNTKNEELTISFFDDGTVFDNVSTGLAFYETFDNGRLLLKDANRQVIDDLESVYYFIHENTLYLAHEPLNVENINGEVWLLGVFERVQ